MARNKWGSVLVSNIAFSWHFCFLLTWVLSCCCWCLGSMVKIWVGEESFLYGIGDSGCWGSESDDILRDGDSCRGCLCVGKWLVYLEFIIMVSFV